MAPPPHSSEGDAGRGGARPVALAVLVALAAAAWAAWACDDAYISFRYARHLAEGAGLCFNLGEAPPIEGYSNLLWVLVLAAGEALGLASPTVAPWLTVAAFAVLVGLVTRDLAARPRATALAMALFVATLPPLVVWATGGLETMPFTLALYLLHRALYGPHATGGGGGRVRAALPAAAAVLLRVDGFALVLALLLPAWLAPRRAVPAPSPGSAPPGSGRPLLAATAAALLACLAQLVFRRLYHGTWAPHTAAVKVDPSAVVLLRGSLYLATVAVSVPTVGLLLLAALARWLPRALAAVTSRGASLGARRERALLAAGLPLAAVLAEALLAGGDFMAYGRLLVPALPFALLLALGPRAGGAPARRALAPLLLLGVVVHAVDLAGALRLPEPLARRLHFRWNDDQLASEGEVWRGMRARCELWVLLGRALGEHTRPGETMVRGAIGAVGYHSELVLLDPYGLVDREVAALPAHPERHSPGHDRQVIDSWFLPRNPDYFTFTDLVSPADPMEGIPPGFLADPFVAERFTVELVELADPGTPGGAWRGLVPAPLLRLVRWRGATGG